MKRVVIIGLNLFLALAGVHIIDAADTAPAVQAGLQEDPPLPVYTPPKKMTPRARVGGSLRGTEGTEPELVALVPDHVGLTMKQTPTLNWYLSKLTAYPLRFTLTDTQKITPIFEGPLPAPTKAGVQSIDLKSMGLALEPNVQYRWFVSAIPNPDSPSRDIVAGGMIERCEFSECLTVASVNVTCDRDSVRTNALIGFWYDAMGCVSSLIEKEPKDPSLRRLRAALLRQVGLNGVADWDLRSIQSHTK
ncbi:MAG: DUF928 domain-containing protein [Nitrospiraceae bacterium]|jgi:hypothetical protein|uniref:DUF928 domain-containing protein n=1 Tax=Nitrospira cf. moscoviensis SBR1015 TaxID=96242 RepID=UPI000A0AB4F1|nr:DUF928 domain-containing protein [Nitrospira cf. moscoviensis SBR1015]MBY0246937.1 DUF928 domain-containing protein [Nitrospiraceae bacterium]OQW36322.1 MAG: hypothetical protein A4E20_07425 [Nitrospira sp. SG-bin2]